MTSVELVCFHDHFLFREPDPELVVAVARILEDVTLERI